MADVSAPQRLQLSRRKGARLPAGTVNVARPTKWGNPLRAGMWRDYTADDAVRDYRKWIARDLTVRSFDITFGEPPSLDTIRAKLRGRDLACWCKPDMPCHADVLVELANK